MDAIQQKAKVEYFELSNKLNTSNKNKDQKTSMYFCFNTTYTKFFAALSSEQKLILCSKKNKAWYPEKMSGFDNLEIFLSILINKQSSLHKISTAFIKSQLFKFPD